jgi:hypothetical protein
MVEVPVHVEQPDDGLPVLVADGPVEPATVADVRAAIERDREERTSKDTPSPLRGGSGRGY